MMEPATDEPVEVCDTLYSVLHTFLGQLGNFGPDIKQHSDIARSKAEAAGPALTSMVFGRWIQQRRDKIVARHESLFQEQHNGGALADLLNTMNRLYFSLQQEQNRQTIWCYLAYFVEMADAGALY